MCVTVRDCARYAGFIGARRDSDRNLGVIVPLTSKHTGRSVVHRQWQPEIRLLDTQTKHTHTHTHTRHVRQRTRDVIDMLDANGQHVYVYTP